MENTKERRYVGVKENFIYGVANGGQVFGYNIVSSYLTFFFVTVFGLPPGAVATMILITGVWDTINDPIMGGLIDKTRTRYGKLRPYLLFVPIPLAITTIVLFSGPLIMQDVKSTALKIVFMYASYLIWELFYTLGDVPFWGMSAAISPNPADRSRAISSARMISSIIGAIATFLIPLLIDASKGGKINMNLREVFCLMGFLAGGFVICLFSLAGVFTRERVVQSTDEPSISDSIKVMFKNKPLVLIIVANILGTIGGFTGIIQNYYYLVTLGFASLSIVASLPGIVSGYAMYFFIPKLQKKWNNKQLIFITLIFRFFVSGIVYLIGIKSYDNAKVIIPLLMVQNLFFSATDSINMVVPTQMVGDTVDYMEWKTGKRNEAMSFSALTFISKITNSVSSAVGTLVLGIVGLATVGDEIVTNIDGVNTNFRLFTFFTIVPTALKLLQLIPYFFYDLVGDKQKMIREEIRIRREQASKEASMAEENREEE